MNSAQEQSRIQSFAPTKFGPFTTADPTIPSSFQRLPIEIKALIIRMLDQQDETYKVRTKGLRLPQSINSTFGKSLNACFLVNKELSELAAVHIFKVSSLLCIIRSITS